MFKNKHTLVAMLVTPILAIFAWYATDMVVSEVPIKPEVGTSYKLAEQANCRWQSGQCGLKNNDVELAIKVKRLENDKIAVVRLHSNIAIDGVRISLANENSETSPKKMQAKTKSRVDWRVLLDWQQFAGSRIRVVIQHGGILFYGDVATTFIN